MPVGMEMVERIRRSLERNGPAQTDLAGLLASWDIDVSNREGRREVTDRLAEGGVSVTPSLEDVDDPGASVVLRVGDPEELMRTRRPRTVVVEQDPPTVVAPPPPPAREPEPAPEGGSLWARGGAALPSAPDPVTSAPAAPALPEPEPEPAAPAEREEREPTRAEAALGGAGAALGGAGAALGGAFSRAREGLASRRRSEPETGEPATREPAIREPGLERRPEPEPVASVADANSESSVKLFDRREIGRDLGRFQIPMLVFGAVLVMIGLIMPWYKATGTDNVEIDIHNGWEWLEVLDIHLLILAFMAAVLVSLVVRGNLEQVALWLARAVVLVGLAAMIAVMYRIAVVPFDTLNGFPLKVDPREGAYADLAGVIIVLVGALAPARIGVERVLGPSGDPMSWKRSGGRPERDSGAEPQP